MKDKPEMPYIVPLINEIMRHSNTIVGFNLCCDLKNITSYHYTFQLIIQTSVVFCTDKFAKLIANNRFFVTKFYCFSSYFHYQRYVVS